MSLLKSKSTCALILIAAAILLSSCSLIPSNEQPHRSQQSNKIYIIKPGDTLSEIAVRFHISLKILIQNNPGIDPKRLQVGSRILLSNDAHSIASSTTSKFIGNPPTLNNKRWNGQLKWPVNNIDVSSNYGRRGFFSKHKGIDLRAPRGTAILASGSGKVTFAQWQGRDYGNLIIIQHSTTYSTAYAHNLKNSVKKGQYVAQGQVIAEVGKSGNASGYHVHFEVRIKGKLVDPEDYLPEK